MGISLDDRDWRAESPWSRCADTSERPVALYAFNHKVPVARGNLLARMVMTHFAAELRPQASLDD
jgi:hypothetical protein